MSPSVQTVWNLNVLPTPISISFNPQNPTIFNDAGIDTLISTPTVTMSACSWVANCSLFYGFVTSSDANLFRVDGVPSGAATVNTKRLMTSGDNGPHSTVITASSGGSNVTGTLNMTVANNTGPAVPAPANQAGFTTLAANYDFSSSFYATQSNWLTASVTNTDNTPRSWFQGTNFYGSNPPADSIAQVFDPVAGQNVMLIKWLPSYFGCCANGWALNMIETVSPDFTSSVHTWPFAYYEVEYRTNGPSANGVLGLSKPRDMARGYRTRLYRI